MTPNRLMAGVLAAMVAGTIALHIWIDVQDGLTSIESIKAMLKYFTYWTNFLAGVVLLGIAFGRPTPAGVLSCLLMSMALVSGVYYTVLYDPNRYAGLDILVDWMMHTVNPLGLLIFWLLYVNKRDLCYRQTMFWQFYPLLYCIYVLIRGQLDGTYPYGFLRPPEIGWGLVMRNIALLSVVFIVTGFGVVTLGSTLARKQSFNS